MSGELLRCPFCGSEAQVVIESSYYMGACTNEECDGTGGLMHVREQAVAAWNRRTSAWPQGDAAVEQLAQAMCVAEHNVKLLGDGSWGAMSAWARAPYRTMAAVVLARLAESETP